MKTTIITLLLFLSISINSQEQFEGAWQIQNSDYKTIIIASEYAVLKVFNYSFKDDYYLEEDIISQNNNKFTTILYNPRNGYEVTITYYFENNKLLSMYEGDINHVFTLHKQ